jgi:hypothetical protein
MKQALKMARELSEEVKAIKVVLETEGMSERRRQNLLETRKELNKERIKALGFTLIQGGKDV